MLNEFFKTNKHLILEIFFILLFSLVPLLWFSSGSMVYGSDSGYPFNFINYFHQRTFTWFGSQGFGSDMSAFMGLVPLHAIQYLISIFNIPQFAVQKISFMFWFGAIAFSMYVCVRYFFRDPDQWIIRIASVVLYSINFYIFLFWQIGSQTTFSAYILLPLMFLIGYRFINKQITAFKAAVLFNLSFFIFNAGGVGGLALLGPSIFLLLFLFIFQFYFESNRKYIFNVIKLLLYSCCLAFFLNAYFLFPFLTSFSQQYNDVLNSGGNVQGVIEWATFVSKFDTYSNLFRLQGENGWYGSGISYTYSYLTNPILIIFSFIFPILTYINMLLVSDRRIKKIMLFLIGLSLVGVFLSAGPQGPLGFLYKALLQYLPGFAVFRSPYYKFAPLIIFSFSILSSMAIYYLSRKLIPKYRILIFFLSILFLLLYHFPFFQVKNFLTGNKYNTMIQVPQYVQEFSKASNLIDDKYRTLVLPPLNKSSGIESFNWDYYSNQQIYPGLIDKSFIQNGTSLNSSEMHLVNNAYNSLRENDIDTFFSITGKLSIKYVLLTSDIYIDILNKSRENPTFYEQKLKNENFRLIWKNGEWSLYEIINPKIKSKIFTFKDISYYDGDLEQLPKNIDQFYFQNTPNTNNLKFKNKLVDLKCTTCTTEEDVNLSFVTVKILPDSIFYPVKKFLEKISLSRVEDSQSVYAYLGQSFKRTNELIRLSDVQSLRNNGAEWIEATNSLINDWENIHREIQKEENKSNALLLKRVLTYSSFEYEKLEPLYELDVVQNNERLKQSITKAIFIVRQAQQIDLSRETSDENSNELIYELGSDSSSFKEILIDSESLIENNNGAILYPNAYKFDNGNLQRIKNNSNQNDTRIFINGNNFTKMHMYFPQQENLLNDQQKEVIILPSKKENCIVGGIKNYEWKNTYRIIFKTMDKGILHAAVYIENIKRSSNKDNNILFEYDQKIEIENESKKEAIIKITGDEDDVSKKIYFCTDLSHEPEKFYNGITVNEVFVPHIYVSEKEIVNDIDDFEDKSNFVKINPAEYLIDLQNTKFPIYLGFTDRYSDSWELLDANGKLLPHAEHFMLNGYANGWYIENLESGKIKLIFKQQSVFKEGIIISMGALVFIFLIVIGSYLIKKEKKK